MSVQTLYTAATGMESLQTKLDVIANNLANVNTTGFKSDRANFEDLFYRHEPYSRQPGCAGEPTRRPARRSASARACKARKPISSRVPFRKRASRSTLPSRGKGFFQFRTRRADQTLYTRAGNFSINAK